ncbi:MAG: class I SAM-dependent methyltransferase [Gammaproteobacteria bacterium]|nr:MAG: class I SAM-dependent methyltransferase [Gammaproteobacteria bacterium]
MSFLTAFFYDSFMAKTEEACLREWRHRLLEQVSGDVLEVGAGTGANIRFYSGDVTRLVLSEPDRHMRKILKQQVDIHGPGNVSIIGGTAEQIESEDESFDYVVTTLVCCSVTNLKTCLSEFRRVLKPGGRFVFLEHVAAADGTSRRRWQNRINPIWKTFMGNCHLNRETEQAIVAEGFEIIGIERESMRKAPPIVRPTIRGIAIKPDRHMQPDQKTDYARNLDTSR